MKKAEIFGVSLGLALNQAFDKKYPLQRCVVCGRRKAHLIVYLIDPFLVEFGHRLKKSKINILQNLNTNKVCLECLDKLKNLENIYRKMIKNNYINSSELSRVRMECRSEVEWYWS